MNNVSQFIDTTGEQTIGVRVPKTEQLLNELAGLPTERLPV